MKRINNIKIYEDLDNNALIKHICKKYHILYEDILDWHIIKKSIDARNKDNIHYLYNIAISFKSEKKYSKFDDYKKFELPNINIKNNNLERPVIVGAGPAGLFAALTFIKNGIDPIIIEQGKKVKNKNLRIPVMQIYSDHFGRVIWLTISPAEVRMDLQDLGPGNED